MRKSRLILLMLAISQISVGQAKKTLIPFELTTHNNISIRAILNQKDTVQLMFHTGATYMTLTEDATKKLKSIAFDKTIDGIKSWGGRTDGARVSEHNSLAIADLTWDNLSITENKFSGASTDGKFGLDLLENKVIDIDYDKKIITVSDKLPNRLKGYEKHKLTYKNGLMIVEATCNVSKDSVLTNSFFLHSGYAGSILIDDKFAKDHKLNERLKITGEKELKDSYGNVLKTKKAILPIFKLGNHTLRDVPVSFFISDLGIQKISTVGGDVLRRFNWIIDAKREFIYLKPNWNFGLVYSKV
jgi:hypothetical protein